MKAVGVVCEYNPFHNGHRYQFEKIKELTNKKIVCVMSGDFVQRAEHACYPKELRAKWAIENGADLVLENPFPFCSMTAELFARSAVSILCRTCLCDTVAFGSECADRDKILALANADIQSKKEIKAYQKLHPELSHALARDAVIKEKTGISLSSPNDILGVEYVKAILSGKYKMDFLPIQRTVERERISDSFASSSALRKLIEEKSLEQVKKYVPEGVYEDIMSHKYLKVHFPKELLSVFMLESNENLKSYAEIGGGLEHRFFESAYNANSFEEFCLNMSGKHLTNAKVRRMALFAFLKVKSEFAKQLPCYTRVLAVREDFGKELKKARGNSQVIIASRNRDVKKDIMASEQFDLCVKSEKVFQKLL